MSLSRLSILLAIGLLGDAATAVCTNWTQDTYSVDDASSFSTTYSIPVDVLVCPSDATANCYFNQQSYDITDKRELRADNMISPLVLPDDEMEAIFQLAQDGFNQEIPKNPREFIDRNGTVTSTTLDEDSIILEVQPGKNKTLLWVSFHLYSTGVLSGCTNETLNNLTVMATSPYLTQDKQRNNMTVLAGGWASVSSNATNSTQDGDDESGAGSLRTSIGSVAGTLMMALTVAGLLVC